VGFVSDVSAGLALIEPEPKSADMIAALRAQDPAIARPLWECFAPTVFRMLRCTLGPQGRINEAAQVVLLCVFERGRRLRPSANLRRFVVRVTARIARIELRRRRVSWFLLPSRSRARRRTEVEGRCHPVAAATLHFYRIIDRLSALDRLAFVLHYVERFEVREVAAAIGASAVQTSRRLRRSLSKVMKGIDGDPALRPAGVTK
jgi:RNA polymerase sigma factor (sigma-70 family)